MSEPDETTRGALERLDQRLGAFEAERGSRSASSGLGGAQDGYRLLGQMLGGVLGGLGLGWAVDHFAHTGPWGIVGGLLIGSGLSVYGAVRTATRMSARAAKSVSTVADVGDEDD
jgi:ATP synthase protein I